MKRTHGCTVKTIARPFVLYESGVWIISENGSES